MYSLLRFSLIEAFGNSVNKECKDDLALKVDLDENEGGTLIISASMSNKRYLYESYFSIHFPECKEMKSYSEFSLLKFNYDIVRPEF